MNQRARETIHYLDNIGSVGLGVDKETHEILVMLKTPVGVLSESLTKERALRLGVELVRLSGQTFRFPPPEKEEANDVLDAAPPDCDPGHDHDLVGERDARAYDPENLDATLGGRADARLPGCAD